MLTNNHPFSVSRASWFQRFKEVNMILQTQTLPAWVCPLRRSPFSCSDIFFGFRRTPSMFLAYAYRMWNPPKKVVPGETRSRLVVSTTTPSCQSLGSQTLSETTHRMDPGLGSDENPTVSRSPAGSWKYGRGDSFNGWPLFMEKMMTNQWVEWRYHIFRQTNIYIWCSQMFSSKMCHLCC